jgi:hypothetical protein
MGRSVNERESHDAHANYHKLAGVLAWTFERQDSAQKCILEVHASGRGSDINEINVLMVMRSA